MSAIWEEDLSHIFVDFYGDTGFLTFLM